MLFFERGRTVEHDARAHPVTWNIRPTQHRRRITQADLGRNALAGGFEYRDLLGTALATQFIGTGEVAHQHDLGDLAAGQQALVSRLVILRMQADTVHARIHLQPNRQRLAQAGLFDCLQLPERMHHTPEIMFDDQWQLIGLEKTFQQQYRCLDAGSSQLQRFLDTRYRETIGLGFQCLGTAHCPMAIGIGLDYSQGFGPGQFPGELIVVAQRLEVDQGTGRTHDGSLLGSLVRNKKPGAVSQLVGRKQRRARDLYGSAATTDSSTRISGSHSLASTVARAQAVPLGSQASQTLFMPWKSASISLR
ncbi:hypothetical protein D3C76_908430 [compost metagenome]